MIRLILAYLTLHCIFITLQIIYNKRRGKWSSHTRHNWEGRRDSFDLDYGLYSHNVDQSDANSSDGIEVRIASLIIYMTKLLQSNLLRGVQFFHSFNCTHQECNDILGKKMSAHFVNTNESTIHLLKIKAENENTQKKY